MEVSNVYLKKKKILIFNSIVLPSFTLVLDVAPEVTLSIVMESLHSSTKIYSNRRWKKGAN